jgi:glycerol kinase
MMGLLGTGVYSSLDVLADTPADAQHYRPAMAAQSVNARYAGWQRAVRQVLAGAGNDFLPEKPV